LAVFPIAIIHELHLHSLYVIPSGLRKNPENAQLVSSNSLIMHTTACICSGSTVAQNPFSATC
jgi:hypothetical protein